MSCDRLSTGLLPKDEADTIQMYSCPVWYECTKKQSVGVNGRFHGLLEAGQAKAANTRGVPSPRCLTRLARIPEVAYPGFSYYLGQRLFLRSCVALQLPAQIFRVICTTTASEVMQIQKDRRPKCAIACNYCRLKKIKCMSLTVWR